MYSFILNCAKLFGNWTIWGQLQTYKQYQNALSQFVWLLCWEK